MDAPRGSVEFEGTDELQRLRRRAYGPDADIAGDALAQARLSELEAARRRELTAVVGAAARGPAAVSERVSVSQPVGGSRPASPSVPQPVDGEFAEHGPAAGSVTGQLPMDGPPAAPWWRRRRRWWVILGGAFAALAVNAAVVAWLSQLLADESTAIPAPTSTARTLPVPSPKAGGYYWPAPDYMLALESVGVDADAPKDPHGILDLLDLSTDELRRYEDFRGLGVWSGKSPSGEACLLLAHPGQGLREGFSADGCSPEGLDTIATLVLCSACTGPGFLDGLPTGGLLWFVLKGDHVDVYVYETGAHPSRG